MIPARSTGDVRPKPRPGERCADCPAESDHACPGVKARRLCDLVDPTHAGYRPGYRETIRAMAAQEAAKASVEMPSPAQQAANLARALWNWAMGGFEVASDEEQARRLSICRACEWFDADRQRCRHHGCGCFMTRKVKLKTEHCPLDPPKW